VTAAELRPLPSRLAAALVFLASGAVLVLEVVGLRLVAPYVGVTLQTSSAVIGVALASIAYGAWTGGWLADRFDPRRLLAPTLLLAAAATAVTLPIVRIVGAWLRGVDPGSILLLAAVTLFLPAALLSAVTPFVIKLQLGDLSRTGRVVGRLSSIGTLGGITATLGTGFVLVAALPTTTIVLCVAGVLAAAGIGIALVTGPRGRNPFARRGGVGGGGVGGGGVGDGAGRSRPPGPPAAVVAVVGIAGAVLAVAAPNPCDVETAYHCALVTVDDQRPGGRTLWLNSARHSYVDLDDPTHLEFAYTRWIGAAIDVLVEPGRPIDALHVGGGGFTLPGYLAATRPGTDNLVLELDAGLVELDRARLGLRSGPDLRVVTGDARVHLVRQPDASRDLVIGDAFGHLVVPWHLATREFAAQIRRVLRPGGVYALNLIDRPPTRFAPAELATVAAAFRHVALVAPPAALAREESANFVVLASAEPLPLAALREALAGTTLEGMPVDDAGQQARLIEGEELRRFIGSAQVLTDDYAPVDQLLGS